MPGQHSELLTALGIEDTGRVITIFRPATGRRHHALAFAIESDGVYRVFVAFQHNKLVAAGDIPDTSCGVPDGDRYALPVRRKDCALNLTSIWFEYGKLDTALRVPDARGAIVRGGENARAVGTVGRDSDLSRMSPEHAT